MSGSSNKGISIYFIFFSFLILFGISISLSDLIIIRFDIAKKVGQSTIAFYAADTGVERALYDIKLSEENEEEGSPFPEAVSSYEETESEFSDWSSINASYETSLTCRGTFTECNSNFCSDCVLTPECNAPRFCILSRGASQDTKRAIEVKY